jgi:hypothetical protein
MNSKKKSLLIINKVQFGYHTDSFKYCVYLKESYNITYICFESGRKKIILEGVEVIYIPAEGTFLNRGIDFFKFSRKHIRQNNFQLIFIIYYQSAALLKLVSPGNKFILDIRTANVNRSYLKRLIYDFLMRSEMMFFENITVISESLAQKLNLKSHKTHILPLGSDVLSETKKSFSTLMLLYVGTLNFRNIHQTLEGLSLYLKESNIKKQSISYDIFGSGDIEEEILITETITNNNLSEIVKFHGRKNHEELKPYFDKCNVGISYIPITDYFDCQPPTKTYEYVNAGLACIATSTQENIKLINDKNGVLCTDNSESFADALNFIYENQANYDSEEIRATLISSSWNNVVSKNLKKYLESF